METGKEWLWGRGGAEAGGGGGEVLRLGVGIGGEEKRDIVVRTYCMRK